uniref:Methylenetetrahydrofolate reductase (NAD(P)H) n=1 Tax=Bionectria ochroleuca TaxID=29856 RepID=A0A8H7TQW6_BIOOC
MHIKQMLTEAEGTGQPSFSFEYFPPKTAQGVQNLYDRMGRMYNFGPKFIDITWGAGGRIAELTCEMVHQAQAVHGLETCMHLTCTDMGMEKVNDALKRAYKAGCTNILALRGDPLATRRSGRPPRTGSSMLATSSSISGKNSVIISTLAWPVTPRGATTTKMRTSSSTTSRRRLTKVLLSLLHRCSTMWTTLSAG